MGPSTKVQGLKVLEKLTKLRLPLTGMHREGYIGVL